MGEYLKEKAKAHTVIHEFSGKMHFFKVQSKSGEEYSVCIQANCDCKFFSMSGVANGNICSHILAVFEEVIKSGNIKFDHDNRNLIKFRRNACMNLVRRSNRIINTIRTSIGESPEHMEKKVEVCKRLQDEGKHFVCEAIFEDGSGRADILVLDDFLAIEIVHTESDESIEKKKRSYPEGIKIEVIKC